MAEPCMDTECDSQETRVKIRVETPLRTMFFSFCSDECAWESLDDTVGRALSKKGQVVMRGV